MAVTSSGRRTSMISTWSGLAEQIVDFGAGEHLGLRLPGGLFSAVVCLAEGEGCRHQRH